MDKQIFKETSKNTIIKAWKSKITEKRTTLFSRLQLR